MSSGSSTKLIDDTSTEPLEPDHEDLQDPASKRSEMGARRWRILSFIGLTSVFCFGLFLISYVLMLLVYVLVPPVVVGFLIVLSIVLGLLGTHSFAQREHFSWHRLLLDLTVLSVVAIFVVLTVLVLNNGFTIFRLSSDTPLWYLLGVPSIIVILGTFLLQYVRLTDMFFMDFLLYLVRTPPENREGAPRYWLRDYLLMRGAIIRTLSVRIQDDSSEEPQANHPSFFTRYLHRPTYHPSESVVYRAFYDFVEQLDLHLGGFIRRFTSQSFLTVLIIAFIADFIVSLYVFVNPVSQVKIPLCILFSFIIGLLMIPIDAAIHFQIGIRFIGSGRIHRLSDVIMTRVLLLLIPPILPFVCLIFYLIGSFFTQVTIPSATGSGFGIITPVLLLLFRQIPIMIWHFCVQIFFVLLYFLQIFLASFLICLLLNLAFFYCYSEYVQRDLFRSLRQQMRQSPLLQRVVETNV